MVKGDNKAAALITIVHDARRERGSRTSYKRVVSALRTLGLDERQRNVVLCYLDYQDAEGVPYPIYRSTP